MERRRLSRDDHAPSPTSGSPGVFDDQYSVDDDLDPEFDIGVADGFRPGNHDGALARSPATALNHQTSVRHSISENFPLDTKPAAAVSNQSSVCSSVPHRLAQRSRRGSVESSASFAPDHTSLSGLSGHTGPSHPYGMYPQATGLTRSASVATSHATMHPQAAFDIGSVGDEVPVGFPGLGQGYHRRLGPDGEEQGIIGPDGHAEQLPPYSRFPEEGPTKASLMAVPEDSELATGMERRTGAFNGVVSSEGPVASTSRESFSSSRNSSGSAPGQAMLQSQGESTTGPAAVADAKDKSWNEKSWQEKRRTKIMCGKVPLWALVAAVVVIVILAVILGVVLGTLMSKAHMQQSKDQDPTVVTVVNPASLFDASSILVMPTGLPSLPVGKYALPIGSPEVSSNECITDSEQNGAWSCSVDGPPLEINIQSATTNSYTMWLSPLENVTAINYGTQAPTIGSQSLSLVIDLDSPSDGPAWHLQTVYDKVVILRYEDFAAGSNLKRDADSGSSHASYPGADFSLRPGFAPRHQVAAGDTPWYCVWNSTFIEAFVYVGKTTSDAVTRVSTGTGQVSSASASASATATSWGTVTSTASPATTLAAVHRRDNDADDDVHWYPRLVKIEERRMSTKNQAYCQKMQLLDDGHMVPVLDNSGQTVVVKLAESDPQYGSWKSSSKRSSSATVRKRDEPSNACHCQWSFT